MVVPFKKRKNSVGIVKDFAQSMRTENLVRMVKEVDDESNFNGYDDAETERQTMNAKPFKTTGLTRTQDSIKDKSIGKDNTTESTISSKQVVNNVISESDLLARKHRLSEIKENQNSYDLQISESERMS